MSEILANHPAIVERLSTHNNIRFDRVSWRCDGHECPSYKAPAMNKGRRLLVGLLNSSDNKVADQRDMNTTT